MRLWNFHFDDRKQWLRELAELRSVIEGGFIALVAHRVHAAARARGIDRCIVTATQTGRETPSSARQEPWRASGATPEIRLQKILYPIPALAP
jgi:DNA-binding FadR family transcriptional regulator